ncbi:uncharacterized protein LOC144110325 isoform X2 [Amblyomma americanum]
MHKCNGTQYLRMDDLNSPSEILFWLPGIQKELAFCRQRAEDPSQPEQRAAKYQRKVQKLRDYYRACCGKLRELDVPLYQESSSSSGSAQVFVRHQVDDGSPEPSGSGGSQLHRALRPLANLRAEDDELSPTGTPQSFASGSSVFEDIPGEHISRVTDIDVVTVTDDSSDSRRRSRSYSSRSDDRW